MEKEKLEYFKSALEADVKVKLENTRRAWSGKRQNLRHMPLLRQACRRSPAESHAGSPALRELLFI